MMDHTETATLFVTAPKPIKLKERLFTIGYVGAITVAMIGWCAALGSAAISAVTWMVS
jgi:hypothetical protein